MLGCTQTQGKHEKCHYIPIAKLDGLTLFSLAIARFLSLCCKSSFSCSSCKRAQGHSQLLLRSVRLGKLYISALTKARPAAS